jgi:DNA-binding transcriptional MerR regulator
MTKQPLEEAGRWLYSKAVIADMQQLARLLTLHLPVTEIAQRMAMKEKDLKRILKLLGVKDDA